MLNFSLSGPTCYTFMQYYLIHLKPIDGINDEYQCLTMLGNYLCTLALLQDRPFSSYRSSLIAASCLLYANRLLNNAFLCNDRLIQITAYREEDLRECIQAIDEIYRRTFHQDETTSSILRRYLKPTKGNEKLHLRIKELIHSSTNYHDDDEDEVFDLTLDEFDQENLSMEHHR